jgi:hypothetical protein
VAAVVAAGAGEPTSTERGLQPIAERTVAAATARRVKRFMVTPGA